MPHPLAGSLSFLRDFLNTGPGVRQSLRHGHKAVQGDLNLDAIRSFVVPVPPPKKRSELVGLLDMARQRRKEMLSAAEELLEGLDDFVLHQLGLVLLPSEDRMAYAVRLSDVHIGRKLYPDYFHPERLNAIRAISSAYEGERAATLGDIADFRRDQRKAQPDDDYLGLANVQSNTGERVDSTDADGEGAVFEYVESDVLFARLRPYLNKVYRAEGKGVCSPEFHVMRIRPDEATGKPRVIPDYLAAILRSRIVLSQTRHMMTGNTHPRLANEDVVDLVVPVPKEKIQQTIAAEAARRRTEARRLRAQAVQLWEQGKADFEAALLGPAQAANRKGK